MTIEKEQLRKILEGAIMAAGQPLSVAKLIGLFEDQDEAPSKEEVIAALEDVQADCQDRGFELKEVGTGWRFQVREETAPWVNHLWDEKPQKYSRALLETLALIAYRQPITRGDIEEIRGVAVSSHIIKTLTEREWVKVVGHRDVPGRPSLYASTRQFLDYFNLKSLEELPSLGEIRDLDELNKELDLGLEKAVANAAVADEATVEAESGEASETGENDSAETENVDAENAAVDTDADAEEASAELSDESDETSAEDSEQEVNAATTDETPEDLDPDFDDSFESAAEVETEEALDVDTTDDTPDDLSASLEESHDA